VIFDKCSIRESTALENVQRRVALLCTGAIRRTETSILMTKLGWDTLKLTRGYQKHVLLFKIIKGLSVSYLTAHIQPSPPSTAGPTRHNKFRLMPKRRRLQCYKSYFFPSMINLWNTLPQHVVDSLTICSFKLSLSRCLSFHNQD